MINKIYVDIFAYKIFTKELNPLTSKPFTIDDVKKQEYKPYILDKIKLLNEEKGGLKIE